MLTFQISEENARVILNALQMAAKGNDVATGVCAPIYSAIQQALTPKKEEDNEDGDKRNNDIQPE